MVSTDDVADQMAVSVQPLRLAPHLLTAADSSDLRF
jgi:hypothetical protein